jgi:cyclopropane fatty-acyl-phospholipid synthase-like methyltransferase
MRPCSEACERNSEPILAVLREVFADRRKVLEIGSGTGQHAVHFAAGLPHLVWQPSDLPEHLPGIRVWCDEAALANLSAPVVLDLNQNPWPDTGADAVFSANTLHIVSWLEVQRLFERVGQMLPARGVLVLYGPFAYGGRHTSRSNARFDLLLRERDPRSGVRNFEDVDGLARAHGLSLVRDVAMPANNRTLVWRRLA